LLGEGGWLIRDYRTKKYKKMKTRFEINDEIFGNSMTLDDMFKYAENEYIKYGFTIDKINQDVYKEYDKEIILNKGDRVNLRGFRIVEWKCYDIDEDLMIYSLREE